MKISTMTSVKSLALILVLMMTVITSSQAQMVYDFEEKPTAVQFRTNGLYWLALSPNIGVELQTDLGLAFLADYVGAWWNNNQKHNYWSDYAFHVEGRYYLGNKVQDTPFSGHHVGLYGIMATYDFEFGGIGYQSNDLSKTWSIGASYGYSLPLTKRLSVDFTIGIGYLQSKYDVYHPEAGWYVRDKTKKLKYFGPTKLEATLVWNLNSFNKK